MSGAQNDDRQEMYSGTKDVNEAHRFDVKKLEAYLADRIEGFQTPLEVRQFKGGQSNPTYQLITPNRKYVLRRKPPGSFFPPHTLWTASSALSRRCIPPAFRSPNPMCCAKTKALSAQCSM